MQTKDAKHGRIIVDDCDADLLVGVWSNVIGRSTYAVKRIGVRMVKLHRLILERKLGRDLLHSDIVDHANGIGLDNRRDNLRLATSSQNNANSGLKSTNTSGFKGVSWYARDSKWQAHIRINKKPTHLGYFPTPEAAHEAYVTAAKKHFGDFANDGDGCLILRDTENE